MYGFHRVGHPMGIAQETLTMLLFFPGVPAWLFAFCRHFRAALALGPIIACSRAAFGPRLQRVAIENGTQGFLGVCCGQPQHGT
jgi:hypothetical protein